MNEVVVNEVVVNEVVVNEVVTARLALVSAGGERLWSTFDEGR